jgi:hypothetical protein
MPPRKQPQPAKTSAVHPAPSPSVSSKGIPKWKGVVIGLLFGLIVLSALWSTGAFKELFAGPKIPLPREVASLSLGMTLDQVLEKYPQLNLGDLLKENPGMTLEEIVKKHSSLKKKLPEMKKTLRTFNNDPLFGIATLNAVNGLTEAASMDLVFFKNQLYFISGSWEAEKAQQIPLQEWAKQYRRWNRTGAGNAEPLGTDVMLKEWHFGDGKTEMTLRDLNYPNHLQRWQDLRDASNGEGQSAFAKYRLDTGTN